MADHIDLAQLRHTVYFIAKLLGIDQAGDALGRHIEWRQIETTASGRALLKDEALIEGDMHCGSWVRSHYSSPFTSASISSLRTVSVTHNRLLLPSSG